MEDEIGELNASTEMMDNKLNVLNMEQDLGMIEGYRQAQHLQTAPDYGNTHSDWDDSDEVADFILNCKDFIKTKCWDKLLDLCKREEMKDSAATKAMKFQIFFFKGVAFYKKSMFFASRNSYQNALALYGKDDQLYYNMGIVYFKLGNLAEAIEYFIRCKNLNPENKNVYNNMSYIYNIGGLYLQTIKICKFAKENCPKAINYYRNWSFALLQLGQLGEAAIKICEAIKKSPSTAENWYLWGIILKKHGDYPEACKKFEKARELRPSNPIYEQELENALRVLHYDQEYTFSHHNIPIEDGGTDSLASQHKRTKSCCLIF